MPKKNVKKGLITWNFIPMAAGRVGDFRFDMKIKSTFSFLKIFFGSDVSIFIRQVFKPSKLVLANS